MDTDAFYGVMVLFRDRFRLVAPSCGTKFAHALIKYRLSQMSLHRIHHPHRKLYIMHEKPRCPRHARSQLGLCGWFYVFSPMNLLLSSFRLGNFPGFTTFPPTRLLPYSFRLGDFPGFTTFPQTRLLPFSFRLGDFPDFPTFSPN